MRLQRHRLLARPIGHRRPHRHRVRPGPTRPPGFAALALRPDALRNSGIVAIVIFCGLLGCMERIEKTVFLSYRRTNFPWALAIFKDLTQHGFDVFFDYTGIASGDFERVIIENIKARAHFVVLLTPSALERCDDSADWLRREIETALATQRNVVPLMLEGFDFGAASIAGQLTGGLAALKQYNGVRIPPDYFDEAMDRLRSTYLNVPLNAVLHPSSRPAERAAAEQKAAANAAAEVKREQLTALQWFERGFSATDLDVKIRCYSEAIRLRPDYAEAFNARGSTRKRKLDVVGAYDDYNEAIRLQPNYTDALYNRAVIIAALTKYNDLGGATASPNELSGSIRDLKKGFEP